MRESVALQGDPVPYHLCRQHLTWSRSPLAEVALLLESATFSGNGIPRSEAVALSMASFLYQPPPELHDLLDLPRTGQCSQVGGSGETVEATLWLLDHTLVGLESHGERLFAVVDPSPGRWEEVVF